MRVITLDRNNALVLRYIHNRRTPILEHKLKDRIGYAYGYSDDTTGPALSHLFALELIEQTDTGIRSINVINIRAHEGDERYTIEAD